MSCTCGTCVHMYVPCMHICMCTSHVLVCTVHTCIYTHHKHTYTYMYMYHMVYMYLHVPTVCCMYVYIYICIMYSTWFSLIFFSCTFFHGMDTIITVLQGYTMYTRCTHNIFKIYNFYKIQIQHYTICTAYIDVCAHTCTTSIIIKIKFKFFVNSNIQSVYFMHVYTSTRCTQ